MDIMKDVILNGLQEVETKPVKKVDKYNPVNDLPFFKDEDFQVIWREYMSVRIKKKASNTDRAIKGAITNLNKLCNGNKRKAIAIVDQSVNSGWTGLFEPKDYVVKVSEKKATNTNKYNYAKEAEENPEDYVKFNMSEVFKSVIKKV